MKETFDHLLPPHNLIKQNLQNKYSIITPDDYYRMKITTLFIKKRKSHFVSYYRDMKYFLDHVDHIKRLYMYNESIIRLKRITKRINEKFLANTNRLPQRYIMIKRLNYQEQFKNRLYNYYADIRRRKKEEIQLEQILNSAAYDSINKLTESNNDSLIDRLFNVEPSSDEDVNLLCEEKIIIAITLSEKKESLINLQRSQKIPILKGLGKLTENATARDISQHNIKNHNKITSQCQGIEDKIFQYKVLRSRNTFNLTGRQSNQSNKGIKLSNSKPKIAPVNDIKVKKDFDAIIKNQTSQHFNLSKFTAKKLKKNNDYTAIINNNKLAEEHDSDIIIPVPNSTQFKKKNKHTPSSIPLFNSTTRPKKLLKLNFSQLKHQTINTNLPLLEGFNSDPFRVTSYNIG